MDRLLTPVVPTRSIRVTERCTTQIIYLLDRSLSLKEDSATEKFAKDAPNAPDINSSSVVTSTH